MERYDLEQALDIVSRLLMGEEVNKDSKDSAAMYEEYISNSEVYDCVQSIMKKWNLSLYEYKGGLYVSAGEKNRVFGYSNEELKKVIGIRLNKELYLCYFIVYNIVLHFYKDSAGDTFAEYIKADDAIRAVDDSLSGVLKQMEILALNEVEENSFRQLAALWEDLPVATAEDMRAARNSKAGYVKMVFNFLEGQNLLAENENRYYPKTRLRALAEEYFEEHQGRLQEIMSTIQGEGEHYAAD